MLWQKFHAAQNNRNSLMARDGRISIFHQTRTESELSLDQIYFCYRLEIEAKVEGAFVIVVESLLQVYLAIFVDIYPPARASVNSTAAEKNAAFRETNATLRFAAD